MSTLPRQAVLETEGLTQALACFVADLPKRDVPDIVQQEARRAMRDCLGAGLAGARENVANIAAQVHARTEGECSLWGSKDRASVGEAALINGCAAHTHALDDTHESMRGHPSVPIVPAILALGEAIDADGDSLIMAYVAGVEVAGRLGRSVNDRHSQVGWHTTCTLGAVGAAASCASLLRLNEEKTRHALGIASSMAGGLRVNFGTMTKALHAGLAAQHGVLAAQLAAGGMTASPVALEGHEGFLQLFCNDGSGSASRALQSLGKSFEIMEPGIVYKQYPTCSLMHALIDMVLQARATGVLESAKDIELHCEISARLESVRGKDWPTTGLDAKFHVEYCVAAAAYRGTQDIQDFSDEAVKCSQVLAWADRITVSQGEGFPVANGDYAVLSVVRDGVEFFRHTQDKPCGHPSRPLSDIQHEKKFMHLATAVFSGERATGLWQLLNAPKLCSARTLAAALSAE